MVSYQDYLTDKVEQAAAECGIRVYQAAEFGDCGWWTLQALPANVQVTMKN